MLARYRDELARAAEQAEWREPEDVERAAEQWDLRLLELLGDHDRRLLVGISSALAQLARGTYGTCTECGSPIPAMRLAVLPETTTCIACARGLEPRFAR